MRVALIGAELEDNLAIRYLWAALEQAGHEVVHIVYNERAELAAAAARLAASGAALAGLSMVFTARARQFADLATEARTRGYRGHIVAGGHFAAFHAEELLGDVPAIDSVACGEGEQLIVELAHNLGALDRVDGLVWRDGARLVHNPAAIKPPDLDALPFPPRRRPFDDYLGLPITNMLASRGCSHACSFCSIAAWHRLCGGDRLRLRSPANVAEEMAELYERGVRIFNFHDDNFFLRDAGAMLERVRELRRELARRDVGRIAFAVKCRPDSVHEEVYTLLEEMGLFRVFLGIEAGTEQSLVQLGRGQKMEDNERALDIVNRLDLHACFNLLLLNPDSSLEDLADNVSFLERRPHNPMNFCRTEIYTGTPLERRLRRQERLRGDYWGWDYTIADPRAQAAVEVIYPCFATRNYGLDGLHHQAMRVDYEHQLLSHFFGTTDELRARVKRLVMDINLDTCAHLRSIVAAIERGQADGARRQRLVDDTTARIELANERLGRRATALSEEIAAMAEDPPAVAGWMRSAAVAGLAATITLGSAACDGPRSHPTEMAPTVTVPVPPPDAGPPAPSATAGATGGTADAGLDAGDLDAGSPEDAGPTQATPTAKPAPTKPRRPTHPTEMIAPQPPKPPPPKPAPTRHTEMVPDMDPD